jgi:hypothetical protein
MLEFVLVLIKLYIEGTGEQNVSKIFESKIMEVRRRLSHEDGGSMFPRNSGIYLRVHTAQQLRRQPSTSLAPREPKLSYRESYI